MTLISCELLRKAQLAYIMPKRKLLCSRLLPEKPPNFISIISQITVELTLSLWHWTSGRVEIYEAILV